MSIACKYLSQFLSQHIKREVNCCLNEFKGDTRELFLFFKNLPSKINSLDYEHLLLIDLLVALLDYQLHVISQKKVKFIDIPTEITKSASNFFIRMAEKNLSLVTYSSESEKRDCLNELSETCEYNWNTFVLRETKNRW